MANAPDLSPGVLGHKGSTPFSSTNEESLELSDGVELRPEL